MRDKDTPLTRAELLTLVWSEPITKITADFQVPVTAVTRACEHLHVPRPAAGHWSAVKFGAAPPAPPLPPVAAGGQQSTTFGEWGRRYGKRTPRTSAPVSETPPSTEAPAVAASALHVLAAKTLAAYRGGDVDRKRGVLNAKSGKPHLRLAVRPESLPRAGELLSQMLTRLEIKGFTFVTDPKSPDSINTVLSATNTRVDWFIQEVVERYERELTPEEKERTWIYDQWRYSGTGRLRIVIAEFHPEGVSKSWGDGKNIKLETKLDDAAEGFLVCANGIHAQNLEWDARHRRWEEEARLREEREAWRQAQLKMQTAFQEASDQWIKAESLRRFRTACEQALRSRSAVTPLSAFEDRWLEWADRVVASLDPLKGDYLTKALQSARVCELNPAQLASVKKSADALGIQSTEVESWIAKGASDAAGATAADLVESLAAIARYRVAFPDFAAFRKWLDAPSDMLENRSPLEWLAQGRLKVIGEFATDGLSGQAT